MPETNHLKDTSHIPDHNIVLGEPVAEDALSLGVREAASLSSDDKEQSTAHQHGPGEISQEREYSNGAITGIHHVSCLAAPAPPHFSSGACCFHPVLDSSQAIPKV